MKSSLEILILLILPAAGALADTDVGNPPAFVCCVGWDYHIIGVERQSHLSLDRLLPQSLSLDTRA